MPTRAIILAVIFINYLLSIAGFHVEVNVDDFYVKERMTERAKENIKVRVS